MGPGPGRARGPGAAHVRCKVWVSCMHISIYFLILFYIHILSYIIIYYPILSYIILYHPVLSYITLYLFCSGDPLLFSMGNPMAHISYLSNWGDTTPFLQGGISKDATQGVWRPKASSPPSLCGGSRRPPPLRGLTRQGIQQNRALE